MLLRLDIFQIYHITCEETPLEIVSRLLSNHDCANQNYVQPSNLHVFYYQQPDDKKFTKLFVKGNLLIDDEKFSTDARIGDGGFYGPCSDLENESSNSNLWNLALSFTCLMLTHLVNVNTLATGQRLYYD
ncbi:hypothetical protein C1645_833506 [Glomus cerebriforme]|uniref:Uncharacterized protein n=1 Tax=Glomus cerebriforme TaxID=658196 RepID=A0A397SFK0_9GLOM|nr:hypothetical protein C1645_833506 [Glomus cerebriforme]